MAGKDERKAKWTEVQPASDTHFASFRPIPGLSWSWFNKVQWAN